MILDTNLLKHFRAKGPTIGGISGGRTSALMHVLSVEANEDQPGMYRGVFANTGKEHAKTLDFVQRLTETVGHLTWVEYRPPTTYGAAPRESLTVEVDYNTAARNGEPFEAILKALAEYRREQKDEGPTTPNAVQRICTNYMKIRTMHRWCVAQVGDEYTKLVGLRADEPSRVAAIKKADRGGVHHLTPLADAGIVKQDVLDFWRGMPFDLDIPEHLGNCNKCFLKDEADIAQSYYEEPGDGQWWLDIQERYGDFRRDRTRMSTIFAEASTRMEYIRPAVLRGEVPVAPEGFDPYRFKLLLRQEQRRLRGEKKTFSCACESTQLDIE